MTDHLMLWPLKRDEANAYVKEHHRHNAPVTGDLFRVGLRYGDEIVGVAMVGRPISKELQNREPQTCELLRLCVRDGAPRNAIRTLHGAVLRAAWALGYNRVITYTLASESGNTLRDAGYRTLGEKRKGRSWNTRSRPRIDGHKIADRLFWEQTP